MIQEIVNYMKHLKENSPQIFEYGLEPSKGLHIFVELDKNGKAINFPGKKGVNWDYYDGNEKSSFIENVTPYDLASTFITMNKQQKLDPKQKIHSCSPYALAFNFNFSDDDKKKLGIAKAKSADEKIKNNEKIKVNRVNVILDRIDDYFKNVAKIFNVEPELVLQIDQFKNFVIKLLPKLIEKKLPDEMIEIVDYWNKIKEKEYFKIYLKNINLNDYENAYIPYLSKNVFNKDKYNMELKYDIYGVIDYYTTFNDDKLFLKHQTAFSKDGISFRFSGMNAQLLNSFGKVKQSKIFPNPIPLFIDKNEFSNTDEIISIYKEDKHLTYSQILKKIFEKNEDKVLQNYYLLFFSGIKIEDFDYVSMFRYSLKENGKYPIIKNLFQLTKGKGLVPDWPIKNIFQFEAIIVKSIFDSFLVGGNNEKFWVNYFADINPNSKDFSGETMSATVYQMILKYRKAFYDYIYKSKTQAIQSYMWDEILWNSIIGDLRTDKMTDKGYHSREYNIKEKLNIWFSLYNYFNNEVRIDMASRIPEMLNKMHKISESENEHFESIEEFAFGAGQIIRKILNGSEASDRTHSLLEPFLQKTNITQLTLAIARAFETYKHSFKFYKGDKRYGFDRLMSETMGFETKENLKKVTPIMLAGYFAKSVFQKDSEENNEIEEK